MPSEKLPSDHQGVLLGGGEQQVGWVGSRWVELALLLKDAWNQVSVAVETRKA